VSVEHITRWTCDRCARSEERREVRWQPDDWALLREATPPQSDVNDSEILGFLCFNCRSDLREWLGTPPVADGEDEG
jgi:hypothetical protein